MTTSHSERDPRVLLVAIVVPLVFALTLATFAWPQARLKPRDLPIGLVGPASAAAPVEQKLTTAGGASFDLHRYPDAAAAREAIEDREVEAAVVASPSGVTLLTASASSPLVAALIQHAVTVESPGAVGPHVVDVVPADPDDPRGAVLNSLVLPLVLSSVILAVFLTLHAKPGLLQTGALALASAVAGVVGIAMVQGWLDSLQGDWFTNAAVLGLTMLAIASFIVGSAALVGRAGLVLGALLMVLIGNPWSGLSSSPQLLPEPVGGIGQLLPPGAGGNLLRSTSFFDGNGGAGHLAVLLAWTALGLALISAASVRNRRKEAYASDVVDLPRAA